ncbi:hypothetical protein NIES37_62690 [Tolypothrix tenuis PCC 7101]|uniref:Uncharacterized protein n=2 Tax=Tolypothrix TaxID=111782 RepID=A0A1Z4N958_9CYAN|nr:hypothetical protein NIES37_62690 [Tolypothrix tenuis PCC 7101]BAZ73822.1 hypothetical protein NIES50_23880 [Aulosira laxa NIES-50]
MTMPTQQTINNLNQALANLKWTWQNPRVQAFIQQVELRTGRFINKPEQASDYCLNRLTKFLSFYFQCQQLMSLLKIDSSDPEIQAFFQRHGQDGKLHMNNWETLFKILDMRWFETGGGF